MLACSPAMPYWLLSSPALVQAKDSTSIPPSSRQHWHTQSGSPTNIGRQVLLPNASEQHTAWRHPTRYSPQLTAGLPSELPTSATGNASSRPLTAQTCCTIHSLLPTAIAWRIYGHW